MFTPLNYVEQHCSHYDEIVRKCVFCGGIFEYNDTTGTYYFDHGTTCPIQIIKEKLDETANNQTA